MWRHLQAAAKVMFQSLWNSFHQKLWSLKRHIFYNAFSTL